MHQYTIYCSEQQTKRALELGAPIEPTGIYQVNAWLEINGATYIIPTVEQMITWLEERNIKCFIIPDIYEDDSYNIQINDKLVTTGHSQYSYPCYDTRKEATLAVIDAALEYLTNQK